MNIVSYKQRREKNSQYFSNKDRVLKSTIVYFYKSDYKIMSIEYKTPWLNSNSKIE